MKKGALVKVVPKIGNVDHEEVVQSSPLCPPTFISQLLRQNDGDTIKEKRTINPNTSFSGTMPKKEPCNTNVPEHAEYFSEDASNHQDHHYHCTKNQGDIKQNGENNKVPSSMNSFMFKPAARKIRDLIAERKKDEKGIGSTPTQYLPFKHSLIKDEVHRLLTESVSTNCTGAGHTLHTSDAGQPTVTSMPQPLKSTRPRTTIATSSYNANNNSSQPLSSTHVKISALKSPLSKTYEEKKMSSVVVSTNEMMKKQQINLSKAVNIGTITDRNGVKVAPGDRLKHFIRQDLQRNNAVVIHQLPNQQVIYFNRNTMTLCKPTESSNTRPSAQNKPVIHNSLPVKSENELNRFSSFKDNGTRNAKEENKLSMILPDPNLIQNEMNKTFDLFDFRPVSPVEGGNNGKNNGTDTKDDDKQNKASEQVRSEVAAAISHHEHELTRIKLEEDEHPEIQTGLLDVKVEEEIESTEQQTQGTCEDDQKIDLRLESIKREPLDEQEEKSKKKEIKCKTSKSTPKKKDKEPLDEQEEKSKEDQSKCKISKSTPKKKEKKDTPKSTQKKQKQKSGNNKKKEQKQKCGNDTKKENELKGEKNAKDKNNVDCDGDSNKYEKGDAKDIVNEKSHDKDSKQNAERKVKSEKKQEKSKSKKKLVDIGVVKKKKFMDKAKSSQSEPHIKQENGKIKEDQVPKRQNKARRSVSDGTLQSPRASKRNSWAYYDKRPTLRERVCHLQLQDELHEAYQLLMAGWADYLSMDDIMLRQCEVQNGSYYNYTEDTMKMLSEPDLYVWQLIEDLANPITL